MSGDISTITKTELPQGGIDIYPKSLHTVLMEVLTTPNSLKHLERLLNTYGIRLVSHGYLKGYLGAMVDMGIVYMKIVDNIRMYSTTPDFVVTRRRCTNCNQLLFVYNTGKQVTCTKCNQVHDIEITFDAGALLKPV